MKTSQLACATIVFLVIGLPLFARAQAVDSQSVVSVAHIDIMPQDLKKVSEAFKIYTAAAPKEPGAVQIRMLQQIGSPNHFTLVEIWSDKKSYEAHLASQPIREFKKKIAASLGSPYDERLHTEALDFNH